MDEPIPKRRKLDSYLNNFPITKISFSQLKKKNEDICELFCNNMQKRGFVVVTIDEEESLNYLKEAQKTAIQFFEYSSKEEKEKTKILFDEYGTSYSGLVGYNSPSKAKELFRIRRGVGQIFPSNPPNFQNIIEKSFRILEEIVLNSMELLFSSLEMDFKKFLQKFGEKSIYSENEFSTSPYDLFYYNNKPEFNEIPNCSIHVDPGWMTVVPCSPTPGLEIVDLEADEWICIEKILEATKDVSIFCAKGFQDLSNDKYLAAVHRVGKESKPRCSLVYEMRPTGAITQNFLDEIKNCCNSKI